jgi:hypothetical protein
MAGVPGWALVLTAGLAGTCTPPLIATARSVWPVVAGPELVRTGHALNAALGDTAGVVAPALVGGVAALASGQLALAVLVPGPLLGSLLLARAAPGGGVTRSASSTRRGRRLLGVLAESAGLRTIVTEELALGIALGALDVAAPAAAQAQTGAAALGTLPLTAFAIGSLAITLRIGSRATSRAPGAAYAKAAAAIAVPLAAAPAAAGSVAALAVLMVIAGAAYGVLNVTVFELLDHVVERGAAVEATTWLTSLQGAGIAAGAAAGGALAGHPAAALVLVAVPGAMGAAAVGARRATLTRSR